MVVRVPRSNLGKSEARGLMMFLSSTNAPEGCDCAHTRLQLSKRLNE